MPCSSSIERLAAWAALLLLPASAESAELGPAQPQIVLRWARVPLAVAYHVEISPDPTFETIAVERRLAGESFVWEAVPAQIHYWRVRSLDQAGRPGPWSLTKTIAAYFVPPTLAEPHDGARFLVGQAPPEITLSFRRVRAVRRYRLEVARDATFRRVIWARTTGGEKAVFVPPAVGVFYWRVLGVGEGDQTTEPGETRSLAVRFAPVSLSSPADGQAVAVGRPVEIRWDPLGLVTSYRVEVTRDKDEAAAQVVSSSTVRGTHATFSPPAEGDYAVRVLPLGGPVARPPQPRRVTARAESVVARAAASPALQAAKGPGLHLGGSVGPVAVVSAPWGASLGLEVDYRPASASVVPRLRLAYLTRTLDAGARAHLGSVELGAAWVIAGSSFDLLVGAGLGVLASQTSAAVAAPGLDPMAAAHLTFEWHLPSGAAFADLRYLVASSSRAWVRATTHLPAVAVGYRGRIW